MKVVLREKVDNLGEKDQVVEVRDGYARNFLIPRGLAIPATESEIKKLEERKRIAKRREEKERFKAQRLKEKLESATLVIEREVGEEGKLFGAVTNQDIAREIEKKFKISIDHRKIALDEPIRVIGIRDVAIKLHPEVSIKLKVEVKKKEKE